MLVSKEEDEKFISNEDVCIKCGAVDSRYNKVFHFLDKTQPNDEIILCDKCGDIHFRNTKFKSDYLESGIFYEVIQEFADYDNTLHEVGERWTFYETCYEPVDKELIIFIQYDDREHGMFRMNLSNEKQKMIVENFDIYIKVLK